MAGKFNTGRGSNGTRQTKKRVAAALIADQLCVLLEGYWTESLYDFEKGDIDSEWTEEIHDEMQRILNPIFDRLERITKEFNSTDIKPVYEGRAQ